MKCNNIHIIGIPEGGERGTRGRKPVSRSNDGKLPYFEERKSHTNPGSTEGPNEGEPKEACSKTHHN